MNRPESVLCPIVGFRISECWT